jgi:uncharacterized protein (TIGR04255 family)
MQHAPLIQLLITAQFSPPLPFLNALQVTDLCRGIWPTFDMYEQVSPAGPMPYSFEQLEGQEPLIAPVALMPRIQLGRSADSRLLLFQADRLSYGWQRNAALNDSVDYPGFEVIRDEFLANLAQLRGWASGELSHNFELIATEVAYTDAFRTKEDDGSIRRLSSIFTFLRSDGPSYSVRGFEYGWNETMHGEGVVKVQVNGPITTPGSIPAALLGITATIPTPRAAESQLYDELNRVHDHLRATFERVVEPQRRAMF